MSAPTHRRRPRPFGPIGARTLACLAVLVGLELGLRHLGGFGKWVVQEQSARYGWRMLPDQHGWSRDHAIPEIINRWGFRDERDWAPPRRDAEGRPTGDPDLLRVAVVGNSMTYGTSVAVEETWPRVLEGLLADELERRGDPRRALVMNFAVQGYTLEQMARLCEDRIRDWRPDLVLWPTIAPDVRPMGPARDDAEYGFRRLVIRTALHDFLRRHVVHRWIPAPAGPPPPSTPAEYDAALLEAVAEPLRSAYVALAGEQRGTALFEDARRAAREALAEAPPEQDVGRLTRAVFEVLGEAEPAAEPDPRLELWAAIESNLPEPIWAELDEDFKRAPFRERFRYLWNERARRLDDLGRRLAAEGTELLLVGLPTAPRLVQGAPSPIPRWRESWERTLPGSPPPALFDALEPFVAPMAPLVEALRTLGYLRDGPNNLIPPAYPGADRSLVLLDDPSHYNGAGHALLAETVFRHLLDRGLLDRTAE